MMLREDDQVPVVNQPVTGDVDPTLLLDIRKFFKYVNETSNEETIKMAYKKFEESYPNFIDPSNVDITDMVRTIQQMNLDDDDDLMDAPVNVIEERNVKLDRIRQEIIDSFDIVPQVNYVQTTSTKIKDIVADIINFFSNIQKKERDLLDQYFHLGLLLSKLKNACTDKHKYNLKKGKQSLGIQKYFTQSVKACRIPYSKSYCNFLISFYRLCLTNCNLLNSTLSISYYKKNLSYVRILCNMGEFRDF